MKLGRALVLCSAVSACVSTPPVSPTVAPGATDAIPSDAGRMFAALCINTLPSYAGFAQVAASLPLTQRAGTGTLYHNSQNLSFKQTETGCSMVAGTTSSDPVTFVVDTMRAAIAASTIQGASVDLGERQGPDGKFYLTARTNASN